MASFDNKMYAWIPIVLVLVLPYILAVVVPTGASVNADL